MSSLIEQAALRLEQLRQAGVEVPETTLPVFDATTAGRETASSPIERSGLTLPVQPAVTSRQVNIDLDRLQANGFVVPNAPRSELADQYRVIKRPLIANAVGKGAPTLTHSNLIMITSALPGEGKTFTSVNLAMSIAAELDHTVMLVDADVARPSVLRTLGLPPGPGLLDVLEGKTELSDALFKTNVDKLTILPSGTPHPKATELLASEAMNRLLEDMATRYPDRIIIFDSPPLLLTTEARVLATHMGQIVVVVQAERTYRTNVRHALETIESCPVRLLLMNKSRVSGPDGYGYGYGYSYGYGYGQAAADAQPAPELTARPV